MDKKIKMSISIGFVAFVLIVLMYVQFKTVEETDITAIETMRETELRTELASWKSKYEELTAKMTETEMRINEYREKVDDEQNATQLLASEVKEAESYLGLTALQGEGIIITLSDDDNGNIIYYSDLIRLVNELNLAGAEAISINDERIVSTSEIMTVNNRIILVNTKKVSGPYVIRAIGDKKYMESELNIKGGYIDLIRADNKKIEYVLDDNVVVPAYVPKNETDLNYEYAKKKEVE
ncbi:MAG: DUF881 domain-containing protein [Clostridia bacterium]|nr:DUF881 domain-containing protein [Clostridia bacterium]